MIIAVDTRFLHQGTGQGCNYFTADSLHRFCETHPRHRFIWVADKPAATTTLPKNVIESITGPAIRNRWMLQYWYNYKLPALLRKQEAEVFIAANGICSLRTNIPQCLLLADTSFISQPSFFSGIHSGFYKKQMPAFLNKAAAIGVLSAFSRSVVADHYKKDANRISVVPHDTEALTLSIGEAERENIKDQYAEGREYFLSQGGNDARYNLINLLKAFSLFKRRQKSNMLLLIAGNPGEPFLTELNTYKYRDAVKLLPLTDKKERVRVTASAYAVIHPCLHDEEGLFAREAIQCHVPLVTSNTAALPEVCGNAALYVNPDNFEDIAEKMMLVYKDEDLAKELVAHGRERMNHYQQAAPEEQLWLLIKKAANH